MKQLTITGRTKKGSEAIRIHGESTAKLSFKEKLSMKVLGYEHKIVSLIHPAQILFKIKNPVIERNEQAIDLMIKEIEKTLKTNGAEHGDYKIQVNSV